MQKKGVNLLLNGAFEQGLKHWVCRGQGEGFGQETDGARVYLRAPASIRQSITVQGNSTYLMTWTTSQNGIPLSPVVPILAKENGEQINRPIEFRFDPRAMRGSLTFTTTSDVTRVHIWLFCEEGEAYIEEVWIELETTDDSDNSDTPYHTNSIEYIE